MLPIEKGAEPRELAEGIRRMRSTPDASVRWGNLDRGERGATLRALLRDQGNLCAYCMRRITEESAHVEHIVPQSMVASGDDPASVSYKNLLAVCDGFEGNKAGLTCDRARGNASLSVNPLKPETLKSIRYRQDGRILSEDPEVEKDLDETLNLNQDLLVRNRKAALTEAFKRLERWGRHGGRGFVAKRCSRYIEEHLSRVDMREPYDGAVIYFMQRRARAK